MIRRPVEVIIALERECLKVDAAIAKRNWEACEESWRAQRLLTHELDIAMHDTSLLPADAAAARKRIQRLANYRDAQIKRLRAFNDACATRLANMGRFRSYARTIGQERRSSLLDVTS